MRGQKEGPDNKVPTILQVNTDILFFDIVFLCIAGQDHGQGTISCYVAGCAEAVLKCEDCQHKGSTGISEFQDSCDNTQGSHDGSSWNTGSTDGKNTKKNTE